MSIGESKRSSRQYVCGSTQHFATGCTRPRFDTIKPSTSNPAPSKWTDRNKEHMAIPRVKVGREQRHQRRGGNQRGDKG
eukprot:12892558-Prorocentrum_lima.AAC.1